MRPRRGGEHLLHGDRRPELGQRIPRAAHRRALAAAAAICVASCQRSSIWWRTHGRSAPMRTLPASFSRWPAAGPLVGRQAVLDPGDGLAPVPRPHLLDAHHEDR